MPQKLNKAGKMQDYIPKGNGDASGEYGTSNGTNKNFTTSDKKSKANVITENKSVVVENKGKKTAKEMVEENIKNYQEQEYNGYTIGNLYGDKYDVSYMGDDVLFDTVDEAKAFIDEITGKKDTKANIIDNDLSGKKDNYLNKEIAKLTGLSEKEISNTIKEMGFASSNDKTQDYYEMALQKKYNLPKYAEIKEEKHDKAWYEKADDNYAKAEQHLYTKQQEYENMPEIKQFYEKMGKDILRERKLIYDKLKEFNK